MARRYYQILEGNVVESEQTKRKVGRPRIHDDTEEAKRIANAKRQAARRQRDKECGYQEVRGIRGTTDERELLIAVKNRLGYSSLRDLIFTEIKNIADKEGISYSSSIIRKDHAQLMVDYHYIIDKFGRVSNSGIINEQFEVLAENPLMVTAVNGLKFRIYSLFNDGYIDCGVVKYLPNDDPIIVEIADRYGIII